MESVHDIFLAYANKEDKCCEKGINENFLNSFLITLNSYNSFKLKQEHILLVLKILDNIDIPLYLSEIEIEYLKKIGGDNHNYENFNNNYKTGEQKKLNMIIYFINRVKTDKRISINIDILTGIYNKVKLYNFSDKPYYLGGLK